MRRKLITALVLMAVALFPLQGIRAAVSAAADGNAAMQGMDCECPPEHEDGDRNPAGCMLDPACMLQCSPAAASIGPVPVVLLASTGFVPRTRVTYDGRPSADSSPPL